ncbi:MAG: hypothetical protein ACRD0F_03915 [Acidimicrobiales bacterium]
MQRRSDRRDRVEGFFSGRNIDAALDLLELVDLAWHDCYGEISPAEAVIDDMLLVSRGRPALLISAGLLAVKDWRDLRLVADDVRAEAGRGGPEPPGRRAGPARVQRER